VGDVPISSESAIGALLLFRMDSELDIWIMMLKVNIDSRILYCMVIMIANE